MRGGFAAAHLFWRWILELCEFVVYNYSIIVETKSPKRHMETYTFGISGTSLNMKKDAFGALVHVPFGAPINWRLVARQPVGQANCNGLASQLARLVLAKHL